MVKSKKGDPDINTIKQAIREVFDDFGVATKKDVENIVLEAINKDIIPGMDNMAEDIKTDIGMKIDSLDRKFDAQQTRQDRHNTRIEELEKIHPQGTHLATI